MKWNACRGRGRPGSLEYKASGVREAFSPGFAKDDLNSVTTKGRFSLVSTKDDLKSSDGRTTFRIPQA